VRAGGAAGGTGVSKDVTALDLRTRSNDESGHVEIHGFQALAVVNADGVAEYVKLLRESDGACGHCAYGFIGGRALVDAAMIFPGGLSVMKALDAKR